MADFTVHATKDTHESQLRAARQITGRVERAIHRIERRGTFTSSEVHSLRANLAVALSRLDALTQSG